MHRTIRDRPNMTFRLGVGGRWSAQDLERLLIDILGPTGWSVCLRDGFSADSSGRSTLVETSVASESGILEIVPLGDGLGHSAACLDDEELDAIVISPLTDSATGEESRLVRRHMARFIRQLKPGGATIFAADDPASDIFSSIRLDCRRLGYGLDSRRAAFRIDRCDMPEPMHTTAFRLISPDGDADWPLASNSGDACRLALAALAAVNALGLTSLTTALTNLSDCLKQAGVSELLRFQAAV